MKHLLLSLLCCSLILFSCKKKKDVEEVGRIKVESYPETRKDSVSDDYFGTQINDPYRWLEIDTAKEVEAWVKSQNEVTQNYLSQIDFREKIADRLETLFNYPKFSAPFKKGENLFFFKNDGLQNQSVMYVERNGKEAEVFMDPNKFSGDGTTALTGMSFSNDHKLIAYTTSVAGSDWRTMYVKDVETGALLDDKIEWLKFSSAAWAADGFYYSGYDAPFKGTEYSKATEYAKIYYHKLGTDQAEDILIYEDKEHPKRYFWPQVPESEEYLIIGISEGTNGSSLLWKKLNGKHTPGGLKTLYEGFEYNYSVVESTDGDLFILTDEDAPNYHLLRVFPGSDEIMPVELIPEKDEVLKGVSLVNNRLYASYLKDANSKIVEYDLDGKLIKEVELPGVGTVSGFGGNKEDKEIYFTYTSYTSPPTIYLYSTESAKTEMFRKNEFSMDLDQYVSEQVFYPSKDGTKIPMVITYKKGMVKNGMNPTLLYGYGGFNISITPSFSPSRMVFLENGGVLAVANLRGGGEYGEEWHKAGMLEKKQTVFDDFIAAAEFLISEKFTSSDKLAIEGRSNGGLLVGACMTQRPELFKVALPGVGVLDMLRYHKFTVGWGWAVEYGSSDNEEDFNYLIKYSPLHNIKEGVEYPATLVTTADHDDRVVPAHSFKFIAELQSKHKGDNPVLIRIDEKAGHGAGKPVSKVIDEAADIWSFVFYNLGMNVAAEPEVQ